MLSGIQPTGNLHVGNYLGALKHWVELQNSGKYDCYFFIADLHSLTSDMKADDRREQITRTAAEILAAGIDPEKSTLFVQSHVPAHTELAWIFNCVTPVAELERMTQFKDKSVSQEKNINAGLLTYPALMAADILLYKPEAVPVGDDQIQHLELTRDIAKKFNKRYGEFFAEPKALLTKTPRIKSLLEPTIKMSKSKGLGHVIELADEPAVIEKKLKKAVTATEGGEGSPGVENLLLLLQHFGSESSHQAFVAAEKDGSIRYGDLKKAVGDAISTHFASFRTRRKELLDNHNEIADILIDGAHRASEVANKTMEEVRKLVGIR
ncbi:MAG: Tryptophan-tRNA ligase [Candidatus Magasanikbacteria bacterium GW2011_GWD2_43_18]|uniref:Tryptophan--tRNA ligase n=1 Tax=Candidatus Magasanikbacteria bacterium GW2011_GWE2_42_7 TaxID=1619052 RepID=A0A0G1BA58_9BACT|nr:MAG: Tryptophan-tRNA ligase [Candidatus Magasanikbacteria bacterium GW2011_GWC2_42_27]KKS70255.1 MAG: Tryptophan-tRNA ligase [Candidatus Magasanikbacteria bacterium GW2011_GWE2_42_7]KKT04677.1 MAG: Tryptophan-tRNA ligase [Candidatus Magasanikbacteria bacterium GW2011_GWD2_43_18]KKT24550.1 MAG: Tryptophan-tRNA ligase [Candidatus Magasanikbacteria bacterium GW2011_GWA2_43_9]